MRMTVKDDRKFLVVVTYRPVTNANPCRWMAKTTYGQATRAYAAHPSHSAEVLTGVDAKHEGRTVAVKRLIEKLQDDMNPASVNPAPVISYLGWREDTGEYVYSVDSLARK